ncbi:zwei Ig domain protein zig-8-like [Penaeus chinensis]|uniref:zwei Ig domain protein zig-8-like n=1 Tax=Penaeus chinensis TaxID=139456 RepID=UPI001FB6B6A3|nr:zwei Ig domain protein zig-8-like [Penaeus chinensis]
MPTVPPPPLVPTLLHVAPVLHVAPILHVAPLLMLLAAHTGFALPEPGSKGKKKTGNWKPPEFDESLANNITVMEGDPASLPCVVTRLRGRSVSWIRQRDLHVISANELTFTSDDRFKVVIDNATSSFTLHVAVALRNDTGVYECQVNTRPKLSRPITLTVQVPAATIQGPAELFIKSGSTLVLSCTALLHPDANSTVDWLHNGTKMSIAGPRGGVSIHTERAGQLVSSKLSVVRAAGRDAGNYTCQPDSVHPANTTVYIVEGEFPAAMHHESCVEVPSASVWASLLLVGVVLLAGR